MILITKVTISGFRSFSTGELGDLGHLNVLVGKNSSGKSNILRALSVFFNNEVEPGQALSFQRDLFDSGQRRKKQMQITVEFTLPSSFLLRKKLEHLKTLGNQFTITRIWELDSQLNIVDRFEIDAAGTQIPDPGAFARQFLGLIKFRYIPNRTVPTDILRDESQALARHVFLRMRDQSHAESLMTELTDAARRMLREVSESMEATTSPLHDPTVTTSTLIQMLTMAGFQARGSHGGIVQDGQWGAGHQGFFLYEVLRTLDTDYSRFFGWRQATIWAVEEPESALHHDLEIALASQFRKWSQDSKYRLQVFLTTHSTIFTMAADSGSWVDLKDSSTDLSQMSIQSLVKASETHGVTSWVHPILSHPWNPVILVEGPDDAEVLTHVASLAGYAHLRFVALPTLDPSEPSGGKDSIVTYLKRHQALIRNRQREAPLIVLLDWDVSKVELGKAQTAYGANGVDHVLHMNHSYCDPLMGPDFKGIERFYPPRIALEAHNAGELVLGISGPKPYSISKTQLDSGKHHLLRRFKQVTDPTELKPLQKVLLDVDKSVLAAVTPQRSLFQP
ncbi:MAG: hypothetical protein HBSIN02_25530 [Bacteroidia bacterium]|nr:MAG: hypothetical protein HBSIN02_25530 [Bacteroidia bacterium]